MNNYLLEYKEEQLVNNKFKVIEHTAKIVNEQYYYNIVDLKTIKFFRSLRGIERKT